MALPDLPIVDKTWTEKPPSTLEDIASFIAREGLPQWKLIRQLFNALVTSLNHGTLQLLGVLIRFGSGVPSSADPNGSFYVRTDPPSATTWLYYRFAGAWVLFAAGGGASFTLTDFVQNIGPGTGGHFDLTGLVGLTAGKNVLVVQTAQPIATKGNARDEIEMDAIELAAYVVDAATIRVYWHATGIVVGDYAFGYQVAA